MHNAILVLHCTRYPHKLWLQHSLPVLFIEVRHDDDIGIAGFIFERKKDQPFRCSWPLSCNHTAGNGRLLTIRDCSELSSGFDVCLLQFLASVKHGVWSNSQTSNP